MTWLTHFHQRKISPKGFSCQSCSVVHRCCDFTPFIPNFLVGSSLSSIEGLNFWTSMEASRFHPLGLLPPQNGEDQRICDFFDGINGKCSNWSSRPSECSSYYCSTGLTPVKSEGLSPVETYAAQSNVSFEFEFQMAQAALRASGYSQTKVEAWVEAWNAWVFRREPIENPWKWPIPERLEFYQTLWEWMISQKFDELLLKVTPHVRLRFEKELEIS